MLTPQEVVARARSAIGLHISYKIGTGGMNPAYLSPASKEHSCDCSGFYAWAHKVSRKIEHPRYTPYFGEWLYTDAIYRDAKDPHFGFFIEIPKPALGCAIVFPKREGMKYGHVGIVSQLNPLLVIHCSHGNWADGDAILETGPDVFRRFSAIFAWCEVVKKAV